MHRNTYDNDNSTFSPQGRLHQVEYALEAVKQGSACVGLRSNTHVVLLGLKRSTGELASYQKKLIRIDDHIGVAIAGLTSDARVLSNFMRTQAMSSRMLYNRPLPISRIVSSIADKAQINTQHYGKRPYGVGLLVAGYDNQGPHLYEFTPSGSCLSYHALSIGARSQSAKTYLEANFETFPDASLDELVMHGLRALRETLQQDKELSGLNTSVGIVGLAPSTASDAAASSSGDASDAPPPPPPTTSVLPASTTATATGAKKPALTTFHILEGDALEPYLSRLEPKEEGAAPARQATAVAGEGAAQGTGEGAAQGTGEGEGRMETD